jgi:pimeloyl-ACP methyl ester carboxylesterase
MSMTAWDPVALPLESEYEVLRCDLRGQLLSAGAVPTGIEGHVEDVVELLDKTGRPLVHVVGASFGAFVGLLLAARHPERVASLVAITATEQVTDEMWQEAQPLIEACRAAARGGDGGRVFELLLPGTFSPRFAEAQRDALSARRRQVAALPPRFFEGLLPLLGALQGLDLRPQLGRIRCPVLVVGAGQDRTFPLPHSEALAAAIAGAELRVVPDSGHALVAEATQALIEMLRSFLSRVARRKGES